MSTKQWEKQYQTHPLDKRVIVEKDPHNDGDGWLAVADLRVPLGECEEVGALFSASSDMAQALLESGTKWNSRNGEWHTFVCEEYSRDECTDDCKAARAALKKARVLP